MISSKIIRVGLIKTSNKHDVWRNLELMRNSVDQLDVTVCKLQKFISA
jgi:hypothetical protein